MIVKDNLSQSQRHYRRLHNFEVLVVVNAVVNYDALCIDPVTETPDADGMTKLTNKKDLTNLTANRGPLKGTERSFRASAGPEARHICFRIQSVTVYFCFQSYIYIK